MKTVTEKKEVYSTSPHLKDELGDRLSERLSGRRHLFECIIVNGKEQSTPYFASLANS